MDEDDLSLASTSTHSSSAITAAFVAVAAIVLAAVMLRLADLRSVPEILVGVVAVLGTGYGAARLCLRRSLDERRAHVAALVLLGFVPLLAVESRRALGEPLGNTSAEAWTASIALALACFTAMGALGWRAAAERRRGLDRFIHGAAIASALGCTALVALGVTYLPEGGLPRVAELPPMVTTSDGFAEHRSDARPDEAFGLGRSCIGASCFAMVRSGHEVRSIGPLFSRGSRVELHASRGEHLVLSADGRAIAVAPVVLTDESDWSAPSAAWMARTALPRSFVALASLGLAVAALGLLRRRRLARLLASVRASQQGWVLDNGWLALADGRLARPVAGLEPGPILLQDDAKTTALAYRGNLRDEPIAVRSGARADVLSRLEDATSSAAASMFGWIVPLATPLAVALALALLG